MFHHIESSVDLKATLYSKAHAGLLQHIRSPHIWHTILAAGYVEIGIAVGRAAEGKTKCH
jgi:hypothetical protein